MTTLKFTYPAVRVQQSADGKPLVLFGAPAIEIELWAGVPQKKDFSPDGSETSGFQRTENKNRLEQLKRFYSNEKNIVQNSLICSLKKVDGAQVEFLEETPGANVGILSIEFPDLYKADFVELFKLLRVSLEERLGVKNPPDKKLIEQLKAKVTVAENTLEMEDIDEEEDTDIGESAVLEESHIEEFLRDITARHEILKDISDSQIQKADAFLGFRREALLSFLLPITLVDGQHRLKGANLAARDHLETPSMQDEIAQRIAAGEPPSAVDREMLLRSSRSLPVSLLMEDDPMEQVFQFVIINQKATPIGKSLLGTIISTSLTPDEMESVSERLRDSGVMLEAARAITWAARNPDSPFCNLVERGIDNENSNLLKWSVMGTLIGIFKDLQGGTLFHSKVDYAKRWREKYLKESNIVAVDSSDEAYIEWSKLDGRWRDVFIVFWSKIRTEFGQTDNSEKFNYWGNPRKSNLFNKISLTILASDFFKYLVGAKIPIDDISGLEHTIDDWLEDLSRDYFDRDWELSGVKKDSTGIRAKWSELWADYRENPESLPQIRSYRTPKK